MKFTEGYWLQSESAHSLYAMQVYEIEEIENGMRIVASTGPVQSRGTTLNMPTITIEFTAAAENVISVRAWHYEAYDRKEPRFEVKKSSCRSSFTRNEKEAVLTAGEVSVRVDLERWGYSFWAKGKRLTGCGFRNLGYIRWNRKASSMLPLDNYMCEHEYMTVYMCVYEEEHIEQCQKTEPIY